MRLGLGYVGVVGVSCGLWVNGGMGLVGCRGDLRGKVDFVGYGVVFGVVRLGMGLGVRLGVIGVNISFTHPSFTRYSPVTHPV